ncbi:MAG: oligosaccharide flippase family protein [Microbacterium sp.]|uniref:lipopolysaccharide biosynthesis protein n=1 Tax=Microbacterium sp. TaxID=51671 RepID=UPI003BB11E8E
MSPTPREIGRSTALSMLGNLALPLSTFLTAPLLARSLGVDGRGELAAATAPLMLVLTIAMFGLPEALTYTIARLGRVHPRAVRHTTWMLSVAGAVAGMAMYVAAPALGTGHPSVVTTIQLTCFAVIPSILVGSPRGLAMGLHRWGLVNLEKALTGGVRLAATVAAFFAGILTVELAAVIIAAAPIIGAVAYVPLLRLPAAHRRAALPGGTVTELGSYAARVWLGSVSGILLGRLSQLLLLPLSGPTALGYFAVATNVADASLLLNSAVRDVTTSSSAADDSVLRLSSTARLSLALSLTGGILLVVSLPLWFALVFGEEFAPAIPITVILVLAGVLGTSGSIAGAGLSGRGRPELRSLSLLVALVVNVTLLITLAPPFGAFGAAVATAAGSIVASNLNIIFYCRMSGARFLHFYVIRPDDLRNAARLASQMLKRGES